MHKLSGSILVRPMETPDPSTGADLLEPDDRADAAAAAPPVVAVLVTNAPGPLLDAALASLAAQDYPALSVLVLDNGSADDPTARIAAVAPGAYVRRLPEDVGFAGAANEAIVSVEGATFLLFCHDDVVLDPGAVRIMVEEAYRSNAAIVGPKFVDYDEPEVLLEVGMAVDHYGVPFSGIEPGELDQEQHDAVRDVFYVSNATMLVRADLARELGGFDPKTFPGSDDVDLCWRARLAGARVVVAPDARVRHRKATIEDERPTRRNDAGDLKAWTRGRVRLLVKSYSTVALAWVIPAAFLLNCVEAVAFSLSRRPRRALALLAGWVSAFRELGDMRRARAATQTLRRVDDGDVRDLMVRGSARVRTFLTQRLHAGDRIATVSSRTREAVAHAGARVRASHFAIAGVIVVLVAFGSRSLVFDGVSQVGWFTDWPGTSSLWGTFFSPWRYAMVGADAPAPPAFGLMALLSSLLFGDTDLARTLVVVGAMPLGALGAYRLARPLSSSPMPAVTTSIAYVANPIVRNAVGEALLGPLVFFALAPWILGTLLRASGIASDRTTRVHSVVTVAVLSLLATAAWPPALAFPLLVAAAFACAVPLVRGVHVTARAASVAGASTALVLVLCAPWVLTLFGADAASWGFLPRRPTALADVLSFRTGDAGAGIASWGLLVAAALPLAVATGARLAWAGRAWVLAVASFALAWLPTRLDVDAPVPAPEGVLVPAALGLALAAGLGAAAFVEELRTFRFGWRQVVAVAAALGLALPVLGMAADTFDGRWRLPSDDWATEYDWMADEPTAGGFRVLWIGDPTILPGDAKVAGGVGFALTRDGPSDGRALWAPAENEAAALVGRALTVARDGETVRLGHLIAPAGIRYVAFVERAAPDEGARGRPDPALADALTRQLDLGVSRLGRGATLYENLAFVPRRAVEPEGVEIPSGGDPLEAAARADLAGGDPVTGPRGGSDPAGPGTLLWAEAADGGWRASSGGEALDRRDAFEWTNAFELTERAGVSLTFDAGARRALAYLQLVLWAAAAAVWWRTRPGRAAPRAGA